MVAGYTYAFENETLRDWVFEARKQSVSENLFPLAFTERQERKCINAFKTSNPNLPVAFAALRRTLRV
jgi:hypothetical protein